MLRHMKPHPLLTPPKAGDCDWAKPTRDEERGILKALEDVRGLEAWGRVASMVNHMRGLGLPAGLQAGELDAIGRDFLSEDSVIHAHIVAKAVADLREAGIMARLPRRAVTFMKRHIGAARAGRNVSLAEAVHLIKSTGADVEVTADDWETLDRIRRGNAKGADPLELTVDRLWHMGKAGMDFAPTVSEVKELRGGLEASRRDKTSIYAREYKYEVLAERCDKIRIVMGQSDADERLPLPPLRSFRR